jgi:hypothetical protein
VKSTRTLFALLAIPALLLHPDLARAQSEADRTMARSLADEGREALEKRDFARAAERYGRAMALVNAPTLAIGLARADVGLGKLVAAFDIYNRIVREGALPGAPAAFAHAVGDAQKELDALAPRLASVTLTITGARAAKVTLDDTDVPAVALGLKRPVDPGTHVLRASADGFAPAETSFTVGEGGSQTVALELRPTSGGRALASSGSHSGPDAATSTSRDTASTSGSAQRTIGFVGLGIGVAGLGLGIAEGVVSMEKRGALADVCKDRHCGPSEQDSINAYNLSTTLSTAGFIAAGVGLVGGTVLIATAPKSTQRKSAWIAPVLGIGAVGARGGF